MLNVAGAIKRHPSRAPFRENRHLVLRVRGSISAGFRCLSRASFRVRETRDNNSRRPLIWAAFLLKAMPEKKRTMNEADVREDVAMPLLTKLGYAARTASDIVREKTLEYPKNFLGRKKKSDPPLRGRADYILTVLGAGSWTLEIKAEDVEIDRDAIEQAITYARHPQVAGSYAAILNGRRFVLFHNIQRSDEPPLIDLPIESVADLAATLEATLSPASIRRDRAPPKVDLKMPLAKGFRSTAQISEASILYNKFEWRSSVDIPKESATNLSETCRRMSGLRVTASGGQIWRDDRSRVLARLNWNFPNDDLKKFAETKQFLNMEYVCLTPTLSEDPLEPSIFHVVGDYKVDGGDNLFDVVTWKSQVAGLEAVITYSGQATGYLTSEIFEGIVEARYETTFPAIPGLRIVMFGSGGLRMSILP